MSQNIKITKISEDQIDRLKKEVNESRVEMMKLIEKMTTITSADLSKRIY